MIKSFFNELLKGKLVGHPIHSMLIHFPSALYPTTLLFDWIVYFTKNNCLNVASIYTLVLSILISVMAAIFGSIDYIKVPSSSPAWNKASLHGLLNILWLFIFAILLALKFKYSENLIYPGLGILTIETLTVCGLIFSNYLGGELVFRHRLGINPE